jgi:hypothetical protein
MPLTAAQLTTLKNDLAANANTVLINGVATAINAVPRGPDNAWQIAAWYNGQAAPDFVVWKTNVAIGAVGDAINATELAGLTSLNTTRLQAIAQYAPGGINPSLPDRRQGFNDIFSGAGGVNTRANLLALWKRPATRVEKLLAAGTGSDASPATLAFEGPLSAADVMNAWAT